MSDTLAKQPEIEKVTATEFPMQTSSPDLEVKARRLSFESLLADMPKHFAAEGDLIFSHFLAALSSVFPDGEDYFVRSVRQFRGDITDPILKRQVSGFVGQESVHGREHRVFSDKLAELGYPVKRMAWLAKRGLKARETLSTANSNLAATAAMEHFTATLAELLLTSPESRRNLGHDAARGLFVWHALEESEHKAVAFDVYKAAGGSERTRVYTMKMIRKLLLIVISLHTVTSLLGDRETYRRGVLRSSWKRFKSSAVMDPAVLAQLRDYDRSDFHPNDSDTNELVVRWSEELFGPEGELAGLMS